MSTAERRSAWDDRRLRTSPALCRRLDRRCAGRSGQCGRGGGATVVNGHSKGEAGEQVHALGRRYGNVDPTNKADNRIRLQALAEADRVSSAAGEVGIRRKSDPALKLHEVQRRIADVAKPVRYG